MSDDIQTPGPFDTDEPVGLHETTKGVDVTAELPPIEAKPKRKRRTRAEMEAARAAEAPPVKHFPTIAECRASMGR